MQKVAYITKEGFINQCFEIYINLDTPPQAPPELTSIFIDVEEDFHTLCMFRYYKDGIFKVLPTKPSKHHLWNLQTEQWQEPEGYLQTIQTENTTQVNQLASQKILPKYPIYLQLNLPYDFGQDSVEVQTMRSWIDSVRTLANTAKAEIALATTLPEITTIVDTFKQELAEIS